MTGDQEEVKLGWGKYSLSARGRMVSFLFVIVLMGGTTEYLHMQRATSQEEQHGKISDALDLQTCIQSIPVEDKQRLRQDLLRSSDPRETLRIGWCPWLEKLNNKQ